MTSLTYPSGRIVSNRYTSAARLDRVRFEAFSGQSVGYDYLNVPTGSASDPNTWGYHPHGAMRAEIFGNGATEGTAYNSRLQLWADVLYRPSAFVDGSHNAWQSHTMNWIDGAGHNNGNAWGIIDNLNSDATQSFTYDNLNRLSAAWTNGNLWGNTYQVDAWGNLNKTLAYGTKPPGAWFDQTHLEHGVS